MQAQIEQLSRQPGLEYLGKLSNKAATANPAQWSQVQLAHDNWSYSQQGLTPAGAALLSIAVAAYTGGMGAEMLGGTAATTTSAATLMGSTTLATAVNAGFATLAAQASVAMVNNGGDIGKTLQQLGSEQSIKNLLTVMATAGALDALNSTYFADAKPATVSGQGIDGTGTASSAASITNNRLTTAQASNAFQQNLLKNVTNNIAGAAINSAITGSALDENALSSALSNALITAGMAQGANDTGASALNDFSKKMAHAALGCAGGAAISGTTGGSGCSAGAVGAVVGELAADYYMGNQLDVSKTFDQNIQSAKTFAGVMAATSGVISGGGGDNATAVNIANAAGANAVDNNYFSRSPFASVRNAVARENARLTAQCGTTCTEADFQRIDQQGAKLERTLNLVEMAQRGKLNALDATQMTQLIIELAPATGTLESLAQLITGKQTLTGDETSRLWAAVGVVPFGGVLKPLGSKVGDLASVLAKDLGQAETVAVDAAKVAEKAAASPVDIAHTIGADFNPRTGQVTGGHSLLNNDVRIDATTALPDANGVYKASVSIQAPDGSWIAKRANKGENTMFPKNWDAARIQAEVDSAWNSPSKTVNPKTGQWTAKSDSGVMIGGYTNPRATAYPIYGGKQ